MYPCIALLEPCSWKNRHGSFEQRHDFLTFNICRDKLLCPADPHGNSVQLGGCNRTQLISFAKPGTVIPRPQGKPEFSGDPGDGDDGGIQANLPSGQSPRPMCPRTKYPAQGNPSLRFGSKSNLFRKKEETFARSASAPEHDHRVG